MFWYHTSKTFISSFQLIFNPMFTPANPPLVYSYRRGVTPQCMVWQTPTSVRLAAGCCWEPRGRTWRTSWGARPLRIPWKRCISCVSGDISRPPPRTPSVSQSLAVLFTRDALVLYSYLFLYYLFLSLYIFACSIFRGFSRAWWSAPLWHSQFCL